MDVVAGEDTVLSVTSLITCSSLVVGPGRESGDLSLRPRTRVWGQVGVVPSAASRCHRASSQSLAGI